jgi:uncharacterized protein YraI
VNLRSGPGTEFNIITTLAAGDELAASGRNADSTWLLVTYAAGTGWVAADVVQVVSGAPSALPVVPTPAIPRTAGPTATPDPATAAPTRTPAATATATQPPATATATVRPTLTPTTVATAAPTIGVAPTFAPATATAEP